MKKEIKLYTLPSCPYSELAKTLLDERGLEYNDISIYYNDKMREQLEKETNHHGVPFIFIGDTCIGGYTELKDLDDCGKLTKMLEE
ncbi:MAG: glutaredoxin domain-containing protein [Acetobacterium sp.]|nr:glutaredoxin domain-containing protein [Acetobacterium sp.]